MASPQIVLAADIARRSRRISPRRAALLAGFTATLALTLLPTASAQADQATSVDTAAGQAQVQALADKAEIVVEQYDASQDALSAAQIQLATDRAAITAAQTTVDSTQVQVDAIARDAYESGALGGAASVLLSQDPQAALRGADYLQRVADNRDRELAQATNARNTLVQAQASANQELASVQKLQASLQAEQKAINALIGKQQAALAATQAQAAAQAAARVAAATQVSRSQTRTALPAAKAKAVAPVANVAAPVAKVAAPVATAAAPAVPAVASSKAAAVLRYAYAQLGKAYRYGAAGARTFDCSGLTMKAWAAAGVALSHNAAAQYYSTKHVAKSALQPGDLVYFGRPIHHVGIYIGGGKFIEAPYTGAKIRISNLSARHDYAGASRP
ncbi:MAG TPA: C40 family peptidase [Acidothermaceae bacterium]|nr:C40 family peptidase [Acidothermaceae bacterium]